ncbi:hypothetical protein GCM10022243_13720 [Saccharothrix violaceirubra]|uniref:Tetratricopeptide (TPR) repeat protein n=1 Tax=Saccharothrix violaceirubra TaxID=413306 RepID=A0A7W7SYW6_9PSEU|nr:XRE family transcriptional regulator [Saccharothrix violaceirubra]MBB4963508.1 tetratricopeptide (TPR) repeat protein [Saccharothrix violaceirubra]
MGGRADDGTTRKPNPEIAELLRSLRGRMTLQALAERSHYSISHISNVERGWKVATENYLRTMDGVLDAGGRLLALLDDTTRPDTTRHRPSQLPPAPHVVGRDELLHNLDRFLDSHSTRTSAQVVALDGTAGVGKTAVAVAWAHHIAHRFTDGVLYLDMHGHSPNPKPVDAEQALFDLLQVLGTPQSSMPVGLDARSALLRTLLDGTRTLLVVDNVARTEQIRPLIPASTHCLVLTTSRQRLPGLTVHHDAHCVTVPPLDEPDAVNLIAEIAGADRVHAEPDAAVRIAHSCSSLPLAIRVAAERVAASRHLTLTALAAELSDDTRRLSVLSVGEPADAVRSVFSWSYDRLDASAARLFRLLSLHPGHEFGIDATAALTALSPADAEFGVDALVRAHLLVETAYRRYGFHDLLRAYAAERATTDEPEATSAQRRLLDWYLDSATTACTTLHPKNHDTPTMSRTEALDWLESEMDNLAAATACASRTGHNRVAFGLPKVLVDHLYWRNPWTTWFDALTTALHEARRVGNQDAAGWILRNLGNAYFASNRPGDARRRYAEALESHEDTGNLDEQKWCRIGLGKCASRTGDHTMADLHFATAQRLCEQTGDDKTKATATAYRGDVQRALGNHNAALTLLHQALDTFTTTNDTDSIVCTWAHIAAIHHDKGDLTTALARLQQAHTASLTAANPWTQADILHRLGELRLKTHDHPGCHEAWTQAIALFDHLDDPRAATIRTQLAALTEYRR